MPRFFETCWKAHVSLRRAPAPLWRGPLVCATPAPLPGDSMVLYPLTDAEIPNGHSSATIPAWQAVEKKQKQPARDWWLIAQPDHATSPSRVVSASSRQL